MKTTTKTVKACRIIHNKSDDLEFQGEVLQQLRQRLQKPSHPGNLGSRYRDCCRGYSWKSAPTENKSRIADRRRAQALFLTTKKATNVLNDPNGVNIPILRRSSRNLSGWQPIDQYRNYLAITSLRRASPLISPDSLTLGQASTREQYERSGNGSQTTRINMMPRIF